jgi:signal transduction histidine kinase
VALRPLPLTVLTATGATLVTLVVTFVPSVDFAYRSASLHVALGVAAALIALLAAYLVFGRFRETSRLDDLALVCALTVTAASNLFFAALPAALPSLEGNRFATWSAISGRVLGAALFVVAAFAPDEKLRHARFDARVALAVSGAAIVAIALVVASIADQLPAGIDPALSPSDRGRPFLAGHVSVHAIQLLALVLFAAAAVGFTRRAVRGGPELTVWLACACVLGAFARLHYFLFPSLYSEWVYTGDFFRLGFYALLLVGAVREISTYQRRAAEGAVLEERRRLARDLHDGLAQELGFILLHTRNRIAEGRALSELEPIAAAGERALDEARRAISALTRPIDEPLDVALAQAAEDVAHRVGMHVRFNLAEGVEVEPSTREELLRIVREAVSNAARHAQADMVTVELSNREDVRLRIHDDGVGFDPLRRLAGGHGLMSMRERTLALGGELRIDSAPGRGTNVEIVVPRPR